VFTGIVEEIGEIVAVRHADEVLVLTVRGPLAASDARSGDSLAVNGVCLTVTSVGATDGGAAVAEGPLGSDPASTFTFELVPETLKRSSLADVDAGTRVNLERAVAVGGRLGGHIVQGHVDGVATLLARAPGARSDELRFSLPPDLSRYVVAKGSIAVDGVSLTVADTNGADFTVALIPTTLAHTTLGTRAPGDTVNLEVDVVAKYVERLVAPREGTARHGDDADGTAAHGAVEERWTGQR
jgi:riboflavin synthase